ncbi:MAG: hypothetical protein HQL73_06120 [Magnetococcales bacterium]|nr:hypothetical protein [Magnetococcales bacterium]
MAEKRIYTHIATLIGYALLFWPLAVQTAPAETCLVGFDVGSSGIRAGSPTSETTAKVKADYLADVWQDNRIDATNETTITAFISLPKKLGLTGCLGLAGGYSAWRLAMENGNPGDVAKTLAEFRRRGGVYFFIIPQDVEGSYGYTAAQKILGERLRTPFIIDIGGGSLQIASRRKGWGAPLGQKSWRKLFCQQVKGSKTNDCSPNPVGPQAVELARQVLAPFVAEARSTLGQGFELTAVSPLVVHGMFPLLRTLAQTQPNIAAGVDATRFSRVALAEAIHRLAHLDDSGLANWLAHLAATHGLPASQKTFIPTHVTDMLLLYTLMEGLDIERVEVGEADITNVPGILADPRPREWSRHYFCYLQRLQQQGINAFLSDPNTCPSQP